MSGPPSDRVVTHLCRVCRHRREGCVRRVVGFAERDEWVCQECLEAFGQLTLAESQEER